MEKIYARHSNLSSDIEDTKDGNSFYLLSHSAPSLQIEYLSQQKKTDRPLLNRSRSLEDFRYLSKFPIDIKQENSVVLPQCPEKKISHHSTDNPHYTRGTSLGESVSNDSDSEDTLPDLSDDSPSGKDNTASPKLVGNIRRKSRLDYLESSKEIPNNEPIEIKSEIVSDEDDCSLPLFSYSQEDEFILISDSDDEENAKTQFEDGKDIGQICDFGNVKLEDADTQPCLDFNDEIKLEQCPSLDTGEVVQIEKTFTICTPIKQQEVSDLSTSPKFMKNKLAHLNSESFENNPMLVMETKKEPKSDSDDSDDLFQDEMENQAIQTYEEREWKDFGIKRENPVSEQDSCKGTYPDRARQKNADLLKMKSENDMYRMSFEEDADCNESLADDGDRDIKNKLKTPDLDDDFLCATQIDTPLDDDVIKTNLKMKPVRDGDTEQNSRKRWKNTTYYDNIDSDDDLFWCATQVDSNADDENPPVLNKETFVLTNSDEDNDDMYMMATQVDKGLLSSCRVPQNSGAFKLPTLSQAKASANANGAKSYWHSEISAWPEADSDSDESLFSVATQLDPQPMDAYDDQIYTTQTQVDFSDKPTETTSSALQKATGNAKKKRKLKHHATSKTSAFLNALHRRNASDSDSDDSVFSLATQVDNDDDDDDILFIRATQVDSQPFKSYKKHKTKSKTQHRTQTSLLTMNDDYDSDDSVYSVSTQIDFEPPRYRKSSKLCLKNLKSQNKTSRTVKNLDEEYDSDSSVFSVATQVDASTSKRKCERIKDDDEEEADDTAYCMATQVDVDKKRTTPAASQKSDIFKVPFFPKKRLKVTPPVEKDTEAVTPGRKETISNSASEIDSPFGSFLLGIAEGEMEQVVMKSSENDVEEAEKNKDANNSEETEKGFSKFLLDLSDVPQSKPVSQTCPVEPLRLKTRKEIRQSFKNQYVKDVPKSPEEKCHPKAVVKASSTNDTWLSKSKKPVQKKKLLEEAAISRKINEARNQLEERYFLSHLDPSKVGWNKSSHIQYGSSSTITDVQLPDEDEIRKKGLPITESLQRRRPLPDIPTEHFPEEKRPDVHDPAVNTPLNTIEQTSPVKIAQVCTNTSPRKSGLVASTQFYKNSRLDTFKIPKLPPLKAKQPCDSVTAWKLNPLQTSSTEKRPTRLPSKSLAQPFELRQNMNEMFKATHTKAGYYVKQPTKKIFSSCDSSNYVQSKQNNHSSKTFCSDNKNQSLQDRRINSNNTRDEIFKHILKWNPKWLSEQKNIKQTPPIVKMDELLPLLNCYTSLEDYQSIFKPLLLLEIWESIYKDFVENCHKNRKWQVAFCNVQILTSLMDYIVYGVISIKDYSSRKQMMEGDIVKVNLQVQDPQATNTGNAHSKVLYPVMGIVVSVRFYDSQFCSEKLEQFPQLASLPEVKSRFKIYRAIIKVRYRKLIHAFTDLMAVELISSSIPHLRQFEALMCLSSNLLYSQILNPSKGESAESGINIPSTRRYNSSQLKAISAAACIVQKPPDQPSYCLVQGPPGTGKSHTIIGIINKIKEINTKCKILLCAPSNGAIDELTRRLIKERHRASAESRQALKVVRIGNLDNIHDDVSSYSISELIKTNNAKIGNQKCEKMYPELNRICINEKKIILKLSNPALREKDDITEEQKRKLEKDLRNLKEKKKFLMKQCELKQTVNEAPALNYRQETELRQSILQKADVICSTLNTCGSLMYLNDLGVQRFDCIIIDEASQCTELDCLIPLQYNCCKLILFGDTEQLAPTVLSQQAADYNYGLSLFERLCNYFKDREEVISNPVIMLNCQYRMHPEICKFASRYIYENKLLTDTNLELRSSPLSIVPYLIFDIQNGEQVRSAHSGSLSNPMEAEFTVDLCEYLISLNTSNSSFAIGIIAPYKLQKNLLQDLLTQRKMKKVEVTTVDGFQGREKDIIIMSCVRAHGSCGKIGFLTNRKRLNVALTRAKYALYIVGHLHSLKIADEDWKSLIEDAHQRNLVVPVKCGNSAKLAFQNCVKS